MMKNNNKLKELAIILAVVLVGLSLFSFGLHYIYKEPLELGSCGLCLELNEEVTNCFGGSSYSGPVQPGTDEETFRDTGITIDYPGVSYGK